MGLYVGGGIGPVGWSMPLVPRGLGKDMVSATGGLLYLCWQMVRWFLLLTWWMLYGVWLFYKYLAIGCWWLGRKGWEWWQIRQGNRAAVEAANRAYAKALADRADAENAAWNSGQPGAEYGQYQPHPLTRQDLHDQDRRAS